MKSFESSLKDVLVIYDRIPKSSDNHNQNRGESSHCWATIGTNRHQIPSASRKVSESPPDLPSQISTDSGWGSKIAEKNEQNAFLEGRSIPQCCFFIWLKMKRQLKSSIRISMTAFRFLSMNSLTTLPFFSRSNFSIPRLSGGWDVTGPSIGRERFPDGLQFFPGHHNRFHRTAD